MSKLLHLPLHELFDLFIGDCLLPSTKKRMQAIEIFELFGAYCEELGLAVPCTVIHIGRLMSRRFQKQRTKSGIQYYCEVKPNLIEESPHEVQETT